MTVAEMVRAMAAAGATPEVIAIAVEAVEARDRRDADRKAERAAARKRQRLSRDNAATVARHDGDNAATVAPGSPQEIITQPPSRLSEANASASDAEPEPTDPVERVWKMGTALLVEMGVPEKQAKSNIGRWMRDSRNDASRVLAAIQRARDHGTGDPVSLVSRIINPIHGPRHGQRSHPHRPAKADARLAAMASVIGLSDEYDLPPEDPGAFGFDFDPARGGDEDCRGLRAVDGACDETGGRRDRHAAPRRLSG